MNEKISKNNFVFWGTSSFATEILEGLSAQNIFPALIVTQPDKPAGRKRKLVPPSVKIWAEKNQIPFQQWEKLDQKIIPFLQKINSSFFLVAAYGKILPKDILTVPSFGSINVHGSLLPILRGASPIQQALLEGKKETGISVILMNEKMDAGPILKQAIVAIDQQDCYPQLEKKLAQAAIEILPFTLHQWLNQKITPQPQKESQATFCSLIQKRDGLIDWQESAEKIFNRWRAFSVWPGIFSFWKINIEKKKKVAIFPQNFSLGKTPNQFFPGQVFLNESQQLSIQTQKGSLIVDSLQLEGGKKMKSQEFILGHRNFIGTILTS